MANRKKEKAQRLSPTGIEVLDRERERRRGEGERTIAYEVLYAYLAGDAVAGLVLAQIIYWSSMDGSGKSRLRKLKGGKYWIAKSYAEWARETGVSESQVKRSIATLVELGVIEAMNSLFAGRHVKHVRLCEIGLAARIEALNKNVESDQDGSESTLQAGELISETAQSGVSEAPQSADSESPENAASYTESTQRVHREDIRATDGGATAPLAGEARLLPDTRKIDKNLGVLASLFGSDRYSSALDNDWDDIQSARKWMDGVLTAGDFATVRKRFRDASANGLDFRDVLEELEVVDAR